MCLVGWFEVSVSPPSMSTSLWLSPSSLAINIDDHSISQHQIAPATTTAMKRTVFSLLVIVLLQAADGRKLPPSSAEQPKAAKSVSFDDLVDADDENGASLYYSTDLDDVSSRDVSETGRQLEVLMSRIVASNSSDQQDLCSMHKAVINDLCLTRFQERSRLKVVVPAENSNNRLFYDDSDHEGIDGHPSDAKRISSPQQVCCEFRLSYMKCLVSNINFVCQPTAFNEIYDQVRGIAEICSRFFAKSGKKCRKRYRQPKPALSTASVQADNSTSAGSST